MVVARELSRDLRLFVANQPTRGVDVGSIEFIHKRIIEERDSGTPVLLVSSELDEVVALADPHCCHVPRKHYWHRSSRYASWRSRLDDGRCPSG